MRWQIELTTQTHETDYGYRNVKFDLSAIVIVVLFFACLQAFSVSIANNGVSANYLYVTIPLVFFLFGIARRIIIRKEVLLVLLFFGLIYTFGIPGDIANYAAGSTSPLRRFASFAVFISPICLSFIEFKEDDIELFKKALLLTSLYFAVMKILQFMALDGSVGLYNLKGAIGGQRYGFILLMGLFIALLHNKLFFSNKMFVLQKVCLSVVIFISIIFTFSRSTIVSLMAALVMLLLIYGYRMISHHRIPSPSPSRQHILITIPIVIAAYIIFQNYFEIDFLEFYRTRFFEPLLDATLLNEAMGQEIRSSEGLRFYLLARTAEYISFNPFFGSNFQGIYLLFEEFSSGMSTHNQYADVLLRTGVLGFICWAYLLYRVVKYCSHDDSLFFGLVAVLVYGLFHETFKLSQGAFMFGMLLSFSYLKSNLGSATVGPKQIPGKTSG